MSSQTYSISDLARELDITTRAIRFYEEQGLLSPERREQLEQQLLDIEQMKLELDTAEERCVQALEQTLKSQQAAQSHS